MRKRKNFAGHSGRRYAFIGMLAATVALAESAWALPPTADDQLVRTAAMPGAGNSMPLLNGTGIPTQEAIADKRQKTLDFFDDLKRRAEYRQQQKEEEAGTFAFVLLIAAASGGDVKRTLDAVSVSDDPFLAFESNYTNPTVSAATISFAYDLDHIDMVSGFQFDAFASVAVTDDNGDGLATASVDDMFFMVGDAAQDIVFPVTPVFQFDAMLGAPNGDAAGPGPVSVVQEISRMFIVGELTISPGDSATLTSYFQTAGTTAAGQVFELRSADEIVAAVNTAKALPEPSSVALLGLGGILIIYRRQTR